MNYTVVVDTGPLVALLDEGDQYHTVVVNHLAQLPSTWKTCEAVLVEATFILRKNPQGIQRLGEMFQRSMLLVDYSAQADLEVIFREMKSYQKLPMSFADACLVRMMEREKNARLFTLDRHFEVYRYKGRRLIPRVEIVRRGINR